MGSGAALAGDAVSTAGDQSPLPEGAVTGGNFRLRSVEEQTFQQGHDTRRDQQQRPGMVQMDPVEGIQQKPQANRNQPDGNAQGSKHTVAVHCGAVTLPGLPGFSHATGKDPPTQANQNDAENDVGMNAVTEPGRSQKKDTTESDEPDGAARKTAQRGGSHRHWVRRVGASVCRRSRSGVYVGFHC